MTSIIEDFISIYIYIYISRERDFRVMDSLSLSLRGGCKYFILCSSTTFVGNMPSTNYSLMIPMIGLKKRGFLLNREVFMD
jgi:hypothetical protein